MGAQADDREEMMRITSTARPLTAVAASVMLASAVACAPTGRSAGPAEPRTVSFVDVTNSSWFDVVVYSVGSGTRWRLGMVTSMSNRTFRIPRRDLLTSAGLRLMADPIGSPHVFVSERIVMSPGDRVAFTVAPHLAQSYFAIRH
jgi:hypothetical protein